MYHTRQRRLCAEGTAPVTCKFRSLLLRGNDSAEPLHPLAAHAARLFRQNDGRCTRSGHAGRGVSRDQPTLRSSVGGMRARGLLVLVCCRPVASTNAPRLASTTRLRCACVPIHRVHSNFRASCSTHLWGAPSGDAGHIVEGSRPGLLFNAGPARAHMGRGPRGVPFPRSGRPKWQAATGVQKAVRGASGWVISASES